MHLAHYKNCTIQNKTSIAAYYNHLLNMKASSILKADSIEKLRSLGSYYSVKSCLEEALGNKLGVTGWESLFEKVNFLKDIVFSNKDYLLSICDAYSFKESKHQVAELLRLRLKVRGRSELREKIGKVIAIFCANFFDPYDYYERTKLNKFKNSSKLEGIQIETPDESSSLESVLAKYRRQI